MQKRNLNDKAIFQNSIDSTQMKTDNYHLLKNSLAEKCEECITNLRNCFDKSETTSANYIRNTKFFSPRLQSPKQLRFSSIYFLNLTIFFLKTANEWKQG